MLGAPCFSTITPWFSYHNVSHRKLEMKKKIKPNLRAYCHALIGDTILSRKFALRS